LTRNPDTEILKVSGTPTSDATMDVHPVNALRVYEDDSDDGLPDFEDASRIEDAEEHELNWLKMLESHSQANLKQNGICF
jgi:hypothetical protein